MTYKDKAFQKLVEVLKTRKGFGESKEFYALKQEILSKLGERAWEKMLHKAKVQVAKGK